MTARKAITRAEALGQAHPPVLPHGLDHRESIAAAQSVFAVLWDVVHNGKNPAYCLRDWEKHLGLLRQIETLTLPDRLKFAETRRAR